MNDDSYWKVALPELLAAFDGIPFEENPNGEPLLINRSVTEWEVKAALKGQEAPRVFWLHKKFLGGITKDVEKYWLHNDCHDDPQRHQKYRELIDWMTTSIPHNRVITYKEASYKSFKSKDQEWNSQIERWRDDVNRLVESSLDQVIVRRQQWNEHGFGAGKRPLLLLVVLI